MNSNNRSTSYEAPYFGSFGVEHIPKEIKKTHRKQKYYHKYFRIQACDSIMCGYFCIEFIAFMLKDKSLLDYTKFIFS